MNRLGLGGNIDDAGQSGGESRTLAASAGGASALGSGDGGNGATWLDAAAVLPTIGLNADSGGGGGGGGNGYILIRGTGREHIGMAAPAPLMP